MSKNSSVSKSIGEISNKFGIAEVEVKMVIEEFLDSIEETLQKGGLFSIHKFGSFSVRKRAARPGVNVHTREKIQIPEKVSPFFIPSAKMKDNIRAVLKPSQVKFKKLR